MKSCLAFLILAALGLAQCARCPYRSGGLMKWSRDSSWPSGKVPSANDKVVIKAGQKLKLDVSPPCLASITIETGGALIWGNVDNLTVCADYILVHGRMEIGSENCRFTKKTHIKLTGFQNSTNYVPGFGRKFLGVGVNGTLEIHGAEKPSWTKLIQSVTAAKETCGVVFDFKDAPLDKTAKSALYLTVWSQDGSPWDFGIFKETKSANFQAFLESVPTDKVLAVALRGKGMFAKFASILETVLHMNRSSLQDVVPGDSYALITKKGQPGSTVEQHRSGSSKEESSYISLESGDLVFGVKSGGHGGIDFRVLTREATNPCIKVNADVTTWGPGDQVVVASTDFDWRHAEVMTIKACPSCDINEICFTEPFEYNHFGEVSHGIDERAEVGLLSRNILIEGTVSDDCVIHDDQDRNLCKKFKQDTFGGHVKVVRGFKAAHIQGVELYHMGQQKNVGTYPLHFHMCDDVKGNWFKHNSIHDSFTRCVTIHGTDSSEVSHNVCYKHFGHGFFLEDSVEQYNVLDGNLCIGTMHGMHLMSDMRSEWCAPEVAEYCNALSSYWLTHPNNRVVNNVAAGGDGAGFWYLASRRPLTLSKARQAILKKVTEQQAIHSPILEFTNNTVHSYRTGLKFAHTISDGLDKKDGKLVPVNGVFRPDASHFPMAPNGTHLKSYLTGLTAYKNFGTNFWPDGGILIIRNCSFADSHTSLTLTSGSKFGPYVQVQDSLFVGETDNIGSVGDRAKYTNGSFVGVDIYQGPGYLHSAHFERFTGNTSGAISIKKKNFYFTKVSSHVKGLTFGFCDQDDSRRFYNGLPNTIGRDSLDGNMQANFRDLDGSLTGTPDVQLVPNIRFHTTNKCSYRPRGNIAVCPHKYARVDFFGNNVMKTKERYHPMVMRRDERPEDAFSLEGQRLHRYLLIRNQSYTVNFNGINPSDLTLRGFYLSRGDYVRIGICFPKDTKRFVFHDGYPAITASNPAIEVNSIDEVEKDTTGRAYYWDKQRGILSVKVISHMSEDDPQDKSPVLKIRGVGGSNIHHDCFKDAYDGTYNRTENYSEPIPKEKPCAITSSKGYGAPVEGDFFSNNHEQVKCSKPKIHKDHAEPRFIGCFADKRVQPDLSGTRLVLEKIMTVEFCSERCFHQGRAYAGLQRGTECTCSDTYGSYGPSTSCMHKCVGNSTQICGGKFANSIYSTGISQPQV